MKSAIGIMGGTFNPFHNGHLQLALQAYWQFELSKVLVMPSGTPAHKSTKELIAASHRCQMVSGAIADYPYLELSLLEVERKGNTYTSDTLKALHRQNPDLKIYFIIGADSLYDFKGWCMPERICACATILVATRNHTDENLLRYEMEMNSQWFHGRFEELCIDNIDISSQQLRKWIKEGRSVRYYTPDSVIAYIEKEHIYKL